MDDDDNYAWSRLTHGIYVSVTENKFHNAACFTPTRKSSGGEAADEWDFVVPVDTQIAVRVKTMTGSTEPLYFFRRNCRETKDVKAFPQIPWVEGPDDDFNGYVDSNDNIIYLHDNKSVLLDNEMIFHKYENPSLERISETEDIQILILKDKHLKDVVRMRFHTAKWTGKAPARVTSEAKLLKLQALLHRLQTAAQQSR